MTRLHDLYAQEGQSPWLDNIRRGWITSGELAKWVESGVRGLTSNPSILASNSTTNNIENWASRPMSGPISPVFGLPCSRITRRSRRWDGP